MASKNVILAGDALRRYMVLVEMLNEGEVEQLLHDIEELDCSSIEPYESQFLNRAAMFAQDCSRAYKAEQQGLPPDFYAGIEEED